MATISTVRYRVTSQSRGLNGDQLVNQVQLHGLTQEDPPKVDYTQTLSLVITDPVVFAQLAPGTAVVMTLATEA